MEDCGVGEVLVGCVGAGFDVGDLFDDVLGVCVRDGKLGWSVGWEEGRTRLWARNAARRG